MDKARGNVEFEVLRLGAGELATREHRARIACKISLHRGDCVQDATHWIDLKRRETIMGLLFGVEGMRVGGARRVIVPPHLAYGEKGSTGIPPNALLICEVELLELEPSRPIPAKLKLARERKQQGKSEGR